MIDLTGRHWNKRNRMKETYPHGSISKVGKNRFAWIAVTQADRERRNIHDTPLDEYYTGAGYTQSREDAIAAIDNTLGTDQWVLVDSSAKWWHQEQVQKRKKPKQEADGSLGYLYTTYRSSLDDGWVADSYHVHAYRITRITPKFVFIEAEPCGEWTPDGLDLSGWWPTSGKEKRIKRDDLDRQGRDRQKARYAFQQELTFYSSATAAWDTLPEDKREMTPEEKYWGYHRAGEDVSGGVRR